MIDLYKMLSSLMLTDLTVHSLTEKFNCSCILHHQNVRWTIQYNEVSGLNRTQTYYKINFYLLNTQSLVG